MSHQYTQKDNNPHKSSHKTPQTTEQHPSVDLPDAEIVKLQRMVGNRAAQRLIAEGKVQPRRKKKSSKRRTLPPVSGASQSQQIERQPAEEQDHFEQAETPEYFLGADGSDFAAQSSNPQRIQAKAKPRIDAVSMQSQPKVQRGWLGSAWNKVKSVGGKVLGAGANLVKKGAKWAFEKALKAAGVSSKMVMGFLGKAGSAFMNIVTNPAGFLRNLIGGVKQGFGNFSSNIMKHLKQGLMGWLFGTLSGAGVEIPKSFDMKSILTMVMQILGVTADALKMRLAKLIGQKNMARIEKAYSLLSTLISGGIGGLWKMLKQYLGNLKDMVIGEIRNWVTTQVIKMAIVKVISMFNPVSAIVSVIQMIYKVIKFFIERGSQIMALFKAIAGSVGAIVAGNVGALAKKIEEVLARSIPVVIGFLASLLGLGGIANKIKSIINKVRQPVEKAIDKVLKKIVGTVKKLVGKGDKGGKSDGKDDLKKKKQVDAGLATIDKEEKQYMKKGTITQADAKKAAASAKKQHPIFSSIKVVDGGSTWDYEYKVQRAKKKGEQQAGDDVILMPKVIIKFNRNPKHDATEFTRQLKGQEAGLNKIMVLKWQVNRNRYLTEGRSSAGSAEQARFRELKRTELINEKVAELRRGGMSRDDARAEATKQIDAFMKTQAALHDPDQIAGGDPTHITELGLRRINSSLGSQWKTRIAQLDNAVRDAMQNTPKDQHKKLRIHVELSE